MSAPAVEVIAHLDFHEARRCEHSNHENRKHHADGDEVFARIICPHCAFNTGVVVRCGIWVKKALAGALGLHCAECDTYLTKDEATEALTLYGPANGR